MAKSYKEVEVDDTKPTEVMVGPHVYEIVWLTDPEWRENNLDDGEVGVTRRDTNKIYMRLMEGNEQLMRETLLHEVLHVVWGVSGLTYVHGSFDEDDREENIVRMQASPMLHFIQQNPDIVHYLEA